MGETIFWPIVKWITLARRIPGHSEVHRMARADFNIRGWQGRWRHTALTALFFVGLDLTERHTPISLFPCRQVICVPQTCLLDARADKPSAA
jgi:hypothetical protein